MTKTFLVIGMNLEYLFKKDDRVSTLTYKTLDGEIDLSFEDLYDTDASSRLIMQRQI